MYSKTRRHGNRSRSICVGRSVNEFTRKYVPEKLRLLHLSVIEFIEPWETRRVYSGGRAMHENTVREVHVCRMRNVLEIVTAVGIDER